MRSRRPKRLGLAFSEGLVKTHSRFNHVKDSNPNIAEGFLSNFRPVEDEVTFSIWKIIGVGSLLMIAFFGVFLRLFHLQVVQGATNKDLADSNRVQIRVIHAPRGVIYDRNGKILAESNPSFRLGKETLTRDQALSLEAKGDPRFGDLEVDTIRSYPMGEATAHILGYVGEIQDAELKQSEYASYRLGDKLGRSGVEQIYEHFLRGSDGAEIIEIDSMGRRLRTLRRIEPIPGNNLYLAIDADLQKVSYLSLASAVQKSGSCCGAVVVENPNNGEILALASYPSFDNNVFTNPERSGSVSSFFSSPSSPLLNRVIGGSYPPGSTFKISSALAALNSGKFPPDLQIEDTGVMNLGPYSFSNWYFSEYGRKEGMVNLVKALQRSNDIYFYRVGQELGEKNLGEVARKVGFGKKLGIDLPGEVDGLVPSDAWKRQRFDEVWFPGDDLHLAIGQGFLLATPLQVNSEVSFIAANGKLYQPHLVTKITRYDNSTVKEYKFNPIVQNIFKDADIKTVQTGLSLVPKEGGTAWPLFNFSVPTAGKTGTAEFGDPKNRTHAWYTAYAPATDPQISLTALVEAGGEGSTVASPVIKQILTWYFNPDKSQLQSLETAPVATQSARQLGE